MRLEMHLGLGLDLRWATPMGLLMDENFFCYYSTLRATPLSLRTYAMPSTQTSLNLCSVHNNKCSVHNNYNIVICALFFPLLHGHESQTKEKEKQEMTISWWEALFFCALCVSD